MVRLLLIIGSILTALGAYEWFTQEGSPQLFLALGLAMIAVALTYKWLILDADPN